MAEDRSHNRKTASPRYFSENGGGESARGSKTIVHPAAIVESDSIGAGTRVWAFAHVLDGARIGANCNLGDHVFVEGGAVIGDNCTVKNHVCLWDGIHVESDVFIGPGVVFTNDRYPRSPRMVQVQERYADPSNWLTPTRVCRGASIGAAATVLPGVTLGAYSLVAAGAVVTRDVPPFALVVGTPARHVADVCRCGYRLEAGYRESTCSECGETPKGRVDESGPQQQKEIQQESRP